MHNAQQRSITMQNEITELRNQGVSLRKCLLFINLFFVSLLISGCITSSSGKPTITLPHHALVQLKHIISALWAWQGRSITEAVEIWGEPTYKKDDYLYVWEEISTNVHGTFRCKTEMLVFADGLIRTPNWSVVDDEGNEVGVGSEKTMNLSFYLINKAPPGFNYDAVNSEQFTDGLGKHTGFDFQSE